MPGVQRGAAEVAWPAAAMRAATRRAGVVDAPARAQAECGVAADAAASGAVGAGGVAKAAASGDAGAGGALAAEVDLRGAAAAAAGAAGAAVGGLGAKEVGVVDAVADVDVDANTVTGFGAAAATEAAEAVEAAVGSIVWTLERERAPAIEQLCRAGPGRRRRIERLSGLATSSALLRGRHCLCLPRH
jgi:hypothetical protein